MTDLTLTEIKALAKLVKRDIKWRQANVSIKTLRNLENKLIAARADKES